MSETKNRNKEIRFEFTDSKCIPKHFHREVELFYVLEGTAEVTVDGEVSHLKKSDFLLINTNRVHNIQGKSNQYLAGYIHLDYGELCKYLEKSYAYFICDSTKENSERYVKMRKLLLKIFAQYFEKDAIHRISLRILYLNILRELAVYFEIYQEHPKYKKLYGTENNGRKEFIVEYIENHYMEKLTLKEVAGELYLTDTYFSKYMKQNFDVTFLEYVNEVRLRHAVEDLIYSSESLSHIAMDNGFSSTSFFNHIFKKSFGMSPIEYKKAMKQKNAKNGGKEENCINEKIKRHLFYQEPEGEEELNKRTVLASVVQAEEYRKTNLNCQYRKGGQPFRF